MADSGIFRMRSRHCPAQAIHPELLPPEYAQAPGEGAPRDIDYPSRLRSLPPRLVFTNI